MSTEFRLIHRLPAVLLVVAMLVSCQSVDAALHRPLQPVDAAGTSPLVTANSPDNPAYLPLIVAAQSKPWPTSTSTTPPTRSPTPTATATATPTRSPTPPQRPPPAPPAASARSSRPTTSGTRASTPCRWMPARRLMSTILARTPDCTRTLARGYGRVAPSASRSRPSQARSLASRSASTTRTKAIPAPIRSRLMRRSRAALTATATAMCWWSTAITANCTRCGTPGQRPTGAGMPVRARSST